MRGFRRRIRSFPNESESKSQWRLIKSLDMSVLDAFNDLQDLASTQKRWKSPIKKSPIINWGMGKKSTRTNSPSDLSPQGRFFGVPLIQIDDGQLPQQIQSILGNLFRKAPMTIGIFRKSALQRSAKQIRQTLEDGKDVDFKDKHAILLAAVLKDFLRSMPDCLFGCEFFDELLATNSTQDSSQRAEEMKKILNKLPKVNQELLKRLFCLLYHVAKFSTKNNMDSSNLAVCISPSVLWSSAKTKCPLSYTADDINSSTELVQFTIDNFTAIFGDESLSVLGSESDIQLDVDESDSSGDLSGDALSSPLLTAPDSPEVVKQNGCINGFIYKNEKLDVADNFVISKSKPSSPVGFRSTAETRQDDLPKFIDALSSTLKRRILNRALSDNGLNKNRVRLQSPVLRMHRSNSTLTSSTTTAELIAHRESPLQRAASSPSSPTETITKIRVISAKSNEFQRVPSPVLSPTSATPHYSRMMSYHQRQRPAPSYEEATQSVRNAQEIDIRQDSSKTFTLTINNGVENSVATENVRSCIDNNNDTRSERERSTAAIFFSSDEIRNRYISNPRKIRTRNSSEHITAQRSQSHDNIQQPFKEIEIKVDRSAADVAQPTGPFSTIEVHKTTHLQRQLVGGMSYIEEMERKQMLQRRKALHELKLQNYSTTFNVGSSDENNTSNNNNNTSNNIKLNCSFNAADLSPKVNVDPLSVSLDSAGIRSLRFRSKGRQTKTAENSPLRSALMEGAFMFDASATKLPERKHRISHHFKLPSSELFPSEANRTSLNINRQNNWIVKQNMEDNINLTPTGTRVHSRSPTCPARFTYCKRENTEVHITCDNVGVTQDGKTNVGNSTSSSGRSSCRSSMSDDFHDIERLSRDDIAKIMLQEESYV